MDGWKDWHKRAVAVKEAGTKTDADIAAAVTQETGRKAGRAQVNHWFNGVREPTLSQFMALCQEIGADPGQVLFEVPVLPRASGSTLAAATMNAEPRKRPGYAMQEKRLKLRRTGRATKIRTKVAA